MLFTCHPPTSHANPHRTPLRYLISPCPVLQCGIWLILSHLLSQQRIITFIVILSSIVKSLSFVSVFPLPKQPTIRYGYPQTQVTHRDGNAGSTAAQGQRNADSTATAAARSHPQCSASTPPYDAHRRRRRTTPPRPRYHQGLARQTHRCRQ